MKRRKLPASLRFRVLESSGFACVYCGARPPAVKLHVDHLDPVSEGGTDDEDNLVASCQMCNLGKGVRVFFTEDQVEDLTCALHDVRLEVTRATTAWESGGDPGQHLWNARAILGQARRLWEMG